MRTQQTIRRRVSCRRHRLLERPRGPRRVRARPGRYGHRLPADRRRHAGADSGRGRASCGGDGPHEPRGGGRAGARWWSTLLSALAGLGSRLLRRAGGCRGAAGARRLVAGLRRGDRRRPAWSRSGRRVEPLVVAEPFRVGDDDVWIEASPPRFRRALDRLRTRLRGRADRPAGARDSTSRPIPTAGSSRRPARSSRSRRPAAAGRGLALDVALGDLLVFGADGPWATRCAGPTSACGTRCSTSWAISRSWGGRSTRTCGACRSGHRLNAALAARLAAGQGRRASA